MKKLKTTLDENKQNTKKTIFQELYEYFITGDKDSTNPKYKKGLFRRKIESKLLLFKWLGIILFILLNISVFFNAYEKVYHDDYQYPKAKKWEYMAKIVRSYGGIIARFTPLDERGWFLKSFISFEHYLLDKASQYIPDDDLSRHLREWNLFISYIKHNINDFVMYGSGSNYSYEEIRDILDNVIWTQINNIMTLKVHNKYYEINRLNIWKGLSYTYAKSGMAFWYDGKKIDKLAMKNDIKRMERFKTIYDYNNWVEEYYEKKYPAEYKHLTKETPYFTRKHQLLKWILGHMFLHSEQYDKEVFCNIEKNRYLKDYIDTRNKLLEIRDIKGGVINGIDKTLNKYRDKDINYFCKNIKLKETTQYKYID